MKYLHTMVRVLDLEKSLHFFIDILGLQEIRRSESQKGRYTTVHLATAKGEPTVELTYNWDQEKPYTVGRSFGHLAYSVENIYEYCEHLQKNGIAILRPPRDGHMAFIRTPDQISIELLQQGERLSPQEPWLSMPNLGEW